MLWIERLFFKVCVFYIASIIEIFFVFLKKRNSFHKEDALANSVKFSGKPHISGNIHIVLTTKKRLDAREIQWLSRPTT